MAWANKSYNYFSSMQIKYIFRIWSNFSIYGILFYFNWQLAWWIKYSSCHDQCQCFIPLSHQRGIKDIFENSSTKRIKWILLLFPNNTRTHKKKYDLGLPIIHLYKITHRLTNIKDSVFNNFYFRQGRLCIDTYLNINVRLKFKLQHFYIKLVY